MFVSDVIIPPIKRAGIALPDPTQTAQGNWKNMCVVTGHLVEALQACVEFRPGYNLQLLWDSRSDICQGKSNNAGEALMEVTGEVSATYPFRNHCVT